MSFILNFVIGTGLIVLGFFPLKYYILWALAKTQNNEALQSVDNLTLKLFLLSWHLPYHKGINLLLIALTGSYILLWFMIGVAGAIQAIFSDGGVIGFLSAWGNTVIDILKN